MGHEHIRVFLNHYHRALTPDEALPYWQILPGSVEQIEVPATPSEQAKATKAVKSASKKAKPTGR